MLSVSSQAEAPYFVPVLPHADQHCSSCRYGGQSNYCAANAVLDQMAHWGPARPPPSRPALFPPQTPPPPHNPGFQTVIFPGFPLGSPVKDESTALRARHGREKKAVFTLDVV